MSPLTCIATCCCVLISFALGYSDRPYHKSLLINVIDNSTDPNYRLPRFIEPVFYDVIVIPNLDNATFEGLVTIMLNVLNVTDHIVLHLDNSSIPSNTIEASISSDSQEINITKWWVETKYQTLTVVTDTNLTVQSKVNLTISYHGLLGYEMLGFYISTYNTTAANHTLAITQFESTYARKAMPCFDEPAFRAKFKITVCRKPTFNSLSNMPIVSSLQNNITGLVCDIYNVTPSMPTYLVAFGVTDFPNITYKSYNNYRVFAREEAILRKDANYAVSIGQDILNEIGNVVNLSYPLPKMDVVAVPDFDAGAMENWGLSTYREKYVLYNRTKNSWMEKFSVLSVIAHEFGHQWFGDLVTPEWWDYAWLNEAFATYFEYTIPNVIEPDWNMNSSMFVTQAVHEALAMDTGNPRPMTAPVYTPDQIESIFDYVIYEKGGSVLRMTEHMLTTEVWRKGLNMYLSNNSYKTGTPDKLFTALQYAATKYGNPDLPDVKDMLTHWTKQPGFPLIKVMYSATSGNITTYNITQTPYCLDSNVSYTWPVHLTYTTQETRQFNPSNASNCWLIPSRSNTSQISVNGSGWIIFNIDQTAFVRVLYDDDNISKLKTQLNHNHSLISSINRAQLIDNSFHLAKSGHMTYKQTIDLTAYMSKETAFAPWNAFSINYKHLLNLYYNTKTGDALKQYAQKTVVDPFRSLAANINNMISTFDGSLTASTVADFACYVELPECEQLAKKMFEEWRKNKSSSLYPEIKQAVLCTGLRLDTSKEAFMDVLDYFHNCDNGAEQLTIIKAMGCVNNADVAEMYLNVVCEPDVNYVRLQDRWIVFRSLVSTQTGIPIGLKFMSENFQKVKNCLGPRISAVAATLAAKISQNTHIDMVKSIVTNTTVDQRLRDMLNSTVLPAVTKHQSWLISKPAMDIQSWAQDYLKSSGSPAISLKSHVVLMFIVALVTLVSLGCHC